MFMATGAGNRPGGTPLSTLVFRAKIAPVAADCGWTYIEAYQFQPLCSTRQFGRTFSFYREPVPV
jgi:hypothetical protein